MDTKCPDHKVRTRIFELLSRNQLEQDVDTVGELSRTKDDSKYYDHLLGNYSTVRRFLPALLQSIQFEASTAGQPVLKALDFLRKIEGVSGTLSGAGGQSVTLVFTAKIDAEKIDGSIDFAGQANIPFKGNEEQVKAS